MNMQKGHKGDNVKKVQRYLGKVLNTRVSVDGIFGSKTEAAVFSFQRIASLETTGKVDDTTFMRLERMYNELFIKNNPAVSLGGKRFVVFVDAGHGGVDDAGNYVTPGKRAYHSGENFHDGGHYYEGYENRLIAEAFIEACAKEGIMCVRTYHPVKDTSLRERAAMVRDYLQRGYVGYLHSFHSNAISSSNSAEKLLNTTGFGVYTTYGNNLSDKIADEHFKNVKAQFGTNWNYRPKLDKGEKEKDSDREANFYILKYTDLEDFESFFGSILEEFGFHTSRKDTRFITDSETRKKRVKAAVNTALWLKDYLAKK